MRCSVILVLVFALAAASGCATYESMFAVFGDGYSGGTNSQDKQQQFSDDVSQYEH